MPGSGADRTRSSAARTARTARTARATAAAAAAVALLAVTAGCSGLGSRDDPVLGPQPGLAAPSGVPLAAETDPRFAPAEQRSWLTGEAVPPAPVLAVKLDNTAQARPQAGLQAADIVYVQEVEGGTTRLVVVLSSELPARVGPVRSARTSDIRILAGYGSPALAFSGGNAGVIEELRASALRLVGLDASREGYARDPARSAPYDVMADPAALLARAPEASMARDIGFRFGETSGGAPAAFAEYAWSAARLRVDWSDEESRWLLTMNGDPVDAAEGGRVGADTVLFQEVPVVPSPYVDVTGAPSPEVRPIGSGAVTVLRDGRAWTGTWSRPDGSAPTDFTGGDGEPLLFAEGQTWVVYLAEGQSPTLG